MKIIIYTSLVFLLCSCATFKKEKQIINIENDSTIVPINSDYKGESLTKNFLGSKIEYFKQK